MECFVVLHTFPLRRNSLMRRVLCFIIFMVVLSISGCGSNSDEKYQKAVLAFENGDYANALLVLDSIPDTSDPRNIRIQAEQGVLRIEATAALNTGRYESVLRILDLLPVFPESNTMRLQAIAGIERSDIIARIKNAFSRDNYEGVIEILDNNPDFEDDEGFRKQALSGIEKRDNDELLSQAAEMEFLQERLTELSQFVTLEIYTRIKDTIEVKPRGFAANLGTITILMEFDSIVLFSVPHPEKINMRKDDNVLYVDESSIEIEVFKSIAENFVELQRFNSNPLVAWPQADQNLIFEAQNTFKETMAQRIGVERNIESAKRSFMASFEALFLGIGMHVVWENR